MAGRPWQWMSGALLMMLASTATAQDAGFTAQCTILQGNDQVTIQIRAFNGTQFDLTDVTASPLSVSTSGSATLQLVTFPVPRRSLIRNNAHSFKWHGSLSGAGTVTVSGQVTATTPDGATVSTETVTCQAINAEVAPTNTPRIAPTPRPTHTPRPANTPRPTLTPRPTSTPRTPPTPIPTRTPRPEPTLRDTRAPRPTNTPRIRPTATPRLDPTPREANPTHTPRSPLPTRTPVVQVEHDTPTPRLRKPTHTPAPALPTRTPRLPEPTRTAPPTTAPAAIDPSGFTATCRTLQNGDGITVVLSVRNGTGAAIADLIAQSPSIAGSASVSINTGPSPASYSTVSKGANAAFRWTGRLTGPGDAAITVSATAAGQGDVSLSTGDVDCGTANVEAPPPQEVDVTQLIGQCTARAVDGPLILSVRLDLFNGTGADLTDVRASIADIEATGTAEITITNGPNPDHQERLRAGRRSNVKWQGHAVGRGEGFVHVTATGVGPNGEAVSTGVIECPTLLLPPRHRN